MAMNKFMHPRNPYKKPPDFKQLAIDFPEFRKYATQDLSGKVKLNFKDDGAVWALTKSLLKKDFNLDVDILANHLVPTLPLRLNYLLWLEDLLKANNIDSSSISGIDIGTGSCCIYPLLAQRYLSWNMLATEVEPASFEKAVENVTRNNLTDGITVKQVPENTYLVGAVDEERVYHFCMCNPPFYKEEGEEDKSRSEDRPEPKNAPTGTKIELAVQGGEHSFVKRIIDDSAILKDKIRIYTVMLGLKSSVGPIKQYVKSKGALQVSTTVFCQGRTTRWGICWTFDPRLNLALVKSPIERPKPNFAFVQRFPMTGDNNEPITFEPLSSRIVEILCNLEIETTIVDVENNTILLSVKAAKNTWTKSRRKRREEERKKRLGDATLEQDEPPSKRPKPEDETVSSSEPYLEANLTLRVLEDEGQVELALLYIDGAGGKEATNQLLLCLVNQLKSSVK